MPHPRLRSFMSTVTVSAESLDMSDGETKLKVYDQAKAEIHEVNAELAEASLDHKAVSRDCEEMAEAQSAMERFYAGMEASLPDGGLQSQAVEFMAIGIERYQHLFNREEALIPSSESFGGTQPRYKTTVAAMEDLKSFLKEVWEAFKRAMAQLVRSGMQVIAKLNNSAGKLQQRAKKVRQDVSRESGDKTKDVITLTSPARLSIDGEYEPRSVDLVNGLIKFATTVYPEQVKGYLEDLAHGIEKIDPSAGNIESQVSNLYTIPNVFNRLEGDTVSNDRRFAANTAVKRGNTLPGDMALYAAWPEKGSDSTLQRLRAVSVRTQIDILAVPDSSNAPSSAQVDVLSKAELVTMVDKIHFGADQLRKVRSGLYDKEIKRITDAGDKLRKKLDEAEDLSTDDQQLIAAVLRAATAAQKLTTDALNAMYVYVIRTLTAALAVYEYMHQHGFGQADTDAS